MYNTENQTICIANGCRSHPFVAAETIIVSPFVGGIETIIIWMMMMPIILY